MFHREVCFSQVSLDGDRLAAQAAWSDATGALLGYFEASKEAAAGDGW